MKLIVTSVDKDIFGMYEISITINGKPYTYQLSSKYAYDQAMIHYRKGRHANCLAVLNKFNERH